MQKKKKIENFKSFTLNIVYDSICEVTQICNYFDRPVTDCLREGIIHQLKYLADKRITEEELVSNALKKFKWCIENKK